MRVNREEILNAVMWRTGLSDRAAAGTALDATLEALGERLTAPDAVFLAEALPPSLAVALHRLARHTAPRLSALFARIAVSEGVSPSAAVEHGEAVCRALANALGPEQSALLARRLPPEWALLFALPPEERSTDVPPAGTVAGHGHTLATGKPGSSSHPLSEARPPRDTP